MLRREGCPIATWNSFTERYTTGNRISPAVTLTTQDVVAASSSISWTAVTPTGTSVSIEIALSTDNGATWTNWLPCTNGQAVPGIDELESLQNVQLKIKETLTTSDVHASPELQEVNIEIITSWGNIVYGPNKSTLTAWDSISLAWKPDRLSLVVNDAEAGYIENPGLPAALGSHVFIGTDRNGANAINTLVDELRIDKVYREPNIRTGWHKTGVPFYTSEDMKQWPGYVKAETDGLKVYDALGNLRGVFGSWIWDAIRQYGIQIIEGLILATEIRTGAAGAKTHIALKPAPVNSIEMWTDVGGVSKKQFEISSTEGYSGGAIHFLQDNNNGTIMGFDYDKVFRILNNFISTSGLREIGISADKTTISGELHGGNPWRNTNIIRGNIVFPLTDMGGPCGDANNRWTLVRGYLVQSGDMCFEEQECAICGEPFVDGDILSLLVRTIHEQYGTMTVPVHEKCKDIKKSLNIKLPKMITKYRLNEMGEKEAYNELATEQIEKEVVAVHPDYELDELTGKFKRKLSEYNLTLFSEEELNQGVYASDKVAKVTDVVKANQLTYIDHVIEVGGQEGV